jgi:hypothetical protein
MAANRKLSGVIKGRTISGTGNKDGKMLIHFTDGSSMTVKTADTGSNSAVSGGTVKSVTQADTRLTLVFEDDTKQDITLAEATSSVMLRDKDETLEYAD